METIKVLHIVGGGEFGGAERSILDLIRFLPQPYQPMAACFYEGRFQETLQNAGIPCLVVPNQGRYDWRLTGSLREIIRSNAIDIVHTHGVRANFFGRLAGRLERKPVLTTVHSNLEHDYPERSSRWVAWLMERTTRSMSSRFIAVSNGVKRDLVRTGVAPEKIRVVHNGIDLSRWQKNPGDERMMHRELGIPEHVPLIGMVARLHPVKGHAVFFRAAARVLQMGLEAHFVSIGEGHWRGELAQLAEELLPSGSHTFLGFRSDVACWMSGLDIQVNASLAEGLGLSILESMALGIPVVASRVGGIPEIIEHERNGLLFEPGDDRALAEALSRLLREPELANKLGMTGKQTVESKFRLEIMAENTADCYRELLG